MLIRRWQLVLVLVGVAAVLLAVNVFRPVGTVEASQTFTVPAPAPGVAVPWPERGQAAIGAEGSGVIAATAQARPLPIASVAKLMTALVVLELKPLRQGEQGPAIAVTAEDVATLQRQQANGESVVAVQLGQQLTEYQALEGLLIPSGNNFGALLARWASGSEPAHVEAMNAKGKALGLSRTTFADTSGISPDTRSVPADLVRLGRAAMQHPVLAEIVAQPQVTLPGLTGNLYNVNYVLGQDGIVGVKTGNIPEVGAVYVFAAPHRMPDGRRLLLLGAVQGLPTLDLAFSAARNLLRAMRSSLEVRRVVSRDQAVGRYEAPWGRRTVVVARQDLDLLAWQGSSVRAKLVARPVEAPLPAGSAVGSLRVTAGEETFDVEVATTDRLPAPGPHQRALRVTW